jgi:hypothetical protein
MKLIFLITGLAVVLLALPALRRSWLNFLTALFSSAFGIVLPLFVFFFSAFPVPDWKGAALHGWIDCFHLGKLALTPLVLWATTAFFAAEICGAENSTQPRVVLGYFMGAITSCVCLVFGVFCVRFGDEAWLWMLVPIYVAVWYSARVAYLMAKAQIKPKTYLITLLGSLPLWVGSVLWSRRIYQTLPDRMPSCFVVTAAARGHRRVVGPFFEITRPGGERIANQQLLTFWQFEDAWRGQAPRSHSFFRRVYNRFGPVVAHRITRAWMADAVYIALKPVELAAAFFVRFGWSIFKNEHVKEAGSSTKLKIQTQEGNYAR